ncbi:MAG: pyruvate dehydrogenase complex dihydrolipoamide acetyltransferase [Bacteroidetes bacterium]|nr:MAG: pyruvate dehydrogenase complex dihydrolipoamide acetyltransferase [Bacteroidota bacterium]
MAEVIRMPRMSDTMEEGNIIGWLKAEGETVEAGETLAEVETDKATMELDSYFDGVLLHIAVKEGPVPIDGIIAVIGKAGEDWQAAVKAADGGAASNDSTPAEPTAEPAPAMASPETATVAPSADENRMKASPLARNMAKEANVDLAKLAGSGDSGRIVKRDIEAAIAQQGTAPAPSAAPAPTPATASPATPAAPKKEAPVVMPFAYGGGSGDNFEDVPLSQMRKVIARRLGESKFSAPHFYLTIEMNMAKAIALRTRINEIAPTKISFNDLVIKAAAAALRLHPAINSSWMGDFIRINKDINIGVAVAVAEGLLVPVVRYADIKTLSQINAEVKALAGKAKERKLQPDEMTGNTFTISNLGMFGIEEFTAIINPPDACILAVGGIIEKPIVKNGAIEVGNMMKVTLSSDHRVVDGASAAQFLLTFKEIMEDPIRLMV